MKTRTIALVVAILVVGFFISNQMSYQDGLNDQKFKCQMIDEGTWPDIDGYFDRVCKS